MLPDWPEIKEEIQRAYLKALRAATEDRLGFLADVPLVALHEGDSHLYRGPTGRLRPGLLTAFRRNSGSESDVEDMSLRDMLGKIVALAEDMARGRSEHAFEAIGEAVREAGTEVDARGQPFTAGLVLETLDRMEIPFDKHGDPRLPTIVMSPVMAEQAKVELRRLETDSALRIRKDAILAHKKEAWRAREADRTLAG